MSIDFEHSRERECALSADEVVSFICRPRRKKSDGNLDLFLTDPADYRVLLRPSVPLGRSGSGAGEEAARRDP